MNKNEQNAYEHQAYFVDLVDKARVAVK